MFDLRLCLPAVLTACAPVYLAPEAADAGATRSGCEEGAIVSFVNAPTSSEAVLVEAGVYVLGARGIPNRVIEWGPEWDHDWPTWRKMLPIYVDEYVK